MNTLNLSLLVETEKKIMVPKVSLIDKENDERCVIDDDIFDVNCDGTPCSDCIYNISNIELLTKSRKIQSL